MGTQIGVEAVLASAMISLAGCGVEGIGETEDAIIGGTLVDPGDYPATGALLHGGHFHCTATLIAPGVAITAAHCLENSGFGGGFSFTLTADVSSSAQHPKEILRVHVVHQHPNYNPSGAFARLGEVNDIGLVLLESPVTSIPLETLDGPTRAYMPPGSDLVTAGYGLLSYYATSTAGVKRDAVVQVDRVGAYELQTVPSDPQPCRGDSGGPLFVDAPGGRRLTAIVSRSASNDTFCAHGSIATLVTPYLSWIAEESLDRDTGCSVGHDRSSRSTLLLVILPLVVSRLARRARRAAA